MTREEVNGLDERIKELKLQHQEAERINLKNKAGELLVDINYLEELRELRNKQEPCEDCISRQAAIRLAEQGQIQGFMWQIQKLIGLPPVQPKQEPTTKNDLAVDCISRKSVINIIQNHWWNCRDIDKLVNDLPSVTPQEPILDKIRAEIIKYEGDCRLSDDEYPSCKECTDNVFKTIYGILDKYKAESKVEDENDN